MTTDITTMDDAELNRKLAAMAGQFVGGSDRFIPKLSINRAAEDTKTKQDLPVGAFCLNVKAGRVYAKRKEAIQFRLFAKRYGYVKFDAEFENGPGMRKGATVARSVQLPDFKKGSEYISDDGSIKCGKASIPEGQKNPSVKTNIFFYGTASFKGTLADGTEVEVKDEPCYFTIKGKRFLEVDNIFKDFGKDGKRFFDYNLTITPVYRAVADTGVYDMDMVFTDLTNRLPFNQEVFKTLENFFDYINAANRAVEVKFNQAVKTANEDAPQASDTVVAGDSESLDDDLIDQE